MSIQLQSYAYTNKQVKKNTHCWYFVQCANQTGCNELLLSGFREKILPNILYWRYVEKLIIQYIWSMMLIQSPYQYKSIARYCLSLSTSFSTTQRCITVQVQKWIKPLLNLSQKYNDIMILFRFRYFHQLLLKISFEVLKKWKLLDQ